MPQHAPTPGPGWGLVAATSFAPVTWGTTYVVTTLALPDGHPMWSAALRALPAGLVALAVGRALPRGGWWLKALVLGILNIGAFFPLLFVTAYLLPGGVAAIFGALSPLVVALLALPLLGERPTRWRLTWGVLGVVGVALMVLAPGAALSVPGVLAAVGGALSMALGTVLSKRWGRPVGPVPYAGWLLTAGGLVIVPLALLTEGAPPALDGPALAGYAWLGVAGTLLAYVLWFRGVGRMPAGAVAFLPLISPLVATLLGGAVLAEALTPVQGVGFAVALLAVACAQWTPRRRPATHSSTPARTTASAAVPVPPAAPVAGSAAEGSGPGRPPSAGPTSAAPPPGDDGEAADGDDDGDGDGTSPAISSATTNEACRTAPSDRLPDVASSGSS
ncbi:EamA family transporter [Georgenia faecalis]|uniref:EamA family transporter n=1 Tax=Georgenia faecalis TaxID=2483799 RepID=UPI000FD87610|nr:EamA family transporter [Georgenia faecalis]